jgi:hypothetical protein
MILLYKLNGVQELNPLLVKQLHMNLKSYFSGLKRNNFD